MKHWLVLLVLLLSACQTIKPLSPEEKRAAEIRHHCSNLARSAPVQQEPTAYIIMGGMVTPMSGRGQAIMEMQQRRAIEEECLLHHSAR